MQVHTYYYTGVHTPVGLPTGSSRAEDFGTEQLSAVLGNNASTRRIVQFSLSEKWYWRCSVHFCGVTICLPLIFFSPHLVASLILLWSVCWQYILRAHLKEVKQYQRDFRKKTSKESWSSKDDRSPVEMYLWMIYCAIDLEVSRRSTCPQLTHSHTRVNHQHFSCSSHIYGINICIMLQMLMSQHIYGVSAVP